MNSGAEFQASQVTNTQLCCQRCDIMDMDGELTLALSNVVTFRAQQSLHFEDLKKKSVVVSFSSKTQYSFSLLICLAEIYCAKADTYCTGNNVQSL